MMRQRSWSLGCTAPSANRYGRVSPTRPEHVREELGDAVGLILDGGISPGQQVTIQALAEATVIRSRRLAPFDAASMWGHIPSRFAISGSPIGPG